MLRGISHVTLTVLLTTKILLANIVLIVNNNVYRNNQSAVLVYISI